MESNSNYNEYKHIFKLHKSLFTIGVLGNEPDSDKIDSGEEDEDAKISKRSDKVRWSTQ